MYTRELDPSEKSKIDVYNEIIKVLNEHIQKDRKGVINNVNQSKDDIANIASIIYSDIGARTNVERIKFNLSNKDNMLLGLTLPSCEQAGIQRDKFHLDEVLTKIENYSKNKKPSIRSLFTKKNDSITSEIASIISATRTAMISKPNPNK